MKSLKIKHKSLSEEVDEFVISWNQKFPLDYWWRRKHGITFGSEQHRNTTYIQMMIEYREDKMMEELISEGNSADPMLEKEIDKLLPNGGQKIVKMTSKEVDHEFDNMDIANM